MNSTQQEYLEQYCAPGASAVEMMMQVQPGVSLRIVEFRPAAEKGNPPILFVSGWITQMNAWQTVLREMTRDFTVYYIESREKISSQVTVQARYSVEEIGADLVHIVDQLQLPVGAFVCVGSSLGASAIVEAYHQLTRKPRALVLIGPNAVFRVPLIWKIIVTLFYPPMYALLKPPAKWYLKTFRLDVQTDREQYVKYCSAIDAADPWKLKRAVLAVARYAIWPRLAGVDCPVLLVDASQDRLHEPENLRKMETMLPRVERIDLTTNKETHSARMVEELRMFVRRISKFAASP